MRILVVDNDRTALETTAAYLQRQYPDAEIIAVSDGMEAVQYSLNVPVDAVYTEVLMPHIHGFDIARLVRKFRPDAAVCMICETDVFLEQARAVNLSGYYLKPLGMLKSGNLLTDTKRGRVY